VAISTPDLLRLSIARVAFGSAGSILHISLPDCNLYFAVPSISALRFDRYFFEGAAQLARKAFAIP
jgi:hypothetical protein